MHPGPARRAERREEPRQVGQGNGVLDRVRLEPGLGKSPPGGADARAPAPQDRADELLDPAHRADRHRAARKDPVRHGVIADRHEHVAGNRTAGRELEAGPEVADPAGPHRLERDQGPVLVEDDEIDPVEDRVDDGGTSGQWHRGAPP